MASIITHIVSFKYTPSTSETEKALIGSSFLSLRDTCLRNGKKYILEVTGGANNSKEGQTKGYEVSCSLSEAEAEQVD